MNVIELKYQNIHCIIGIFRSAQFTGIPLSPASVI